MIPEAPRNPRLLVVGGTGRLGRLLRRAWSLERKGPEPVWQARGRGRGGDLIFDPLDPEAFRAAAARADAILNLAGSVSDDPALLAQHVTLAAAARNAARDAGVPVFQVSSAAVYGGGSALSEDVPLAPAGEYGAAKQRMEKALSGFPGVTCLRIGNVAGADALLGRAGESRVLDVFPDGLPARRSYIGPQALVAAVSRLTQLAVEGASLPAVINLALPGAVRMDALLAAAGVAWTARPAPACAISHVELDVSRALSLGLLDPRRADAGWIVADLGGLPPETP